MDWTKLLLNLSTSNIGKPVDPGLLYLGMLIDLYKTTNSWPLKEKIDEILFESLPKQVKIEEEITTTVTVNDFSAKG